jgi:hypothetical protein
MVAATITSARQQLAQNHVDKARLIVARQRQILAQLKRCKGQVPAQAHELLTLFEQSLSIFEADLAWIKGVDERCPAAP